jgi:hypothetical protein
MKTLGCDYVTCGQKATYKDYLYLKKVLKYNFEIIDGKITYTTQENTKAENLIDAPKETQ